MTGKKKIVEQHLFHKHIILTAKLKNPPTCPVFVEEWMKQLVEKVDMKILFGPYVTLCETEGNEGVTGVVCIETSHASIHVWHKVNEPFMKFDLYSCKDFSAKTIMEHIEQFSPYAWEYVVLDRNNGIEIVEKESYGF